MSRNGFTLIELLITIMILSSLLFLGSFSYQMLANRWEKQLGTFDNSLSLSRNIQILEKVLSSTLPLVIEDRQLLASNYGFFFIGKKNRLLSITEQGLFSNEYPEIFLLSLKEVENGKFDLIYQALSTEHFLLTSSTQEIVFEHSYLLLEGVSKFELSYFGWDNLLTKTEKNVEGNSASWRSEFSGLNSQALPNEVEVVVESVDLEFSFKVQMERNSLRYLTPYIEVDP